MPNNTEYIYTEQKECQNDLRNPSNTSNLFDSNEP